MKTDERIKILQRVEELVSEAQELLKELPSEEEESY
jgi:hypothetical protein